MAITPSQWSHVLTIPESYTPSAATSGQTLVITESVIAKLSAGEQSTFWSNVQNGGGDVRVCESSDGTNQLPVEVVSLDNVAQTCVIWTRKTSYDGTDNLYVFIGKAGETQPAVTDPFGRNAVWQDYVVSAHLNESPSSASGHYVNSTGNGDGTAPVAPQGNATGAYGNTATDFNGSSNQVDFPASGLGLEVSFSAWAKCDSLAEDQRLLSLYGSTAQDLQGLSALLWMDAGGSGDGWAGFVRKTDGSSNLTPTDSNDALTSWQLINMVVTSGQIRVYVDGTLANTATITGTATIDLVDTLIVGRNWNNVGSGEYFDGAISDARLSNGVIDSAKIATEYENQSDPANFYGTPTIAATGGTVTSDIAFSISAPSFSVNASPSLPQPDSDVSFSIIGPNFSVSADATQPQPDSDIDFSITGPNFSIGASATLPDSSADVGFSIVGPIFSISAFAGTIEIIVDDETNISVPSLSTNINI